jgi:hypothetical protein
VKSANSEPENFRFTRRDLRVSESILQRILEILPGATSWSILLGMFVLSFLKPVLAAVIIIAFDFYWLLRLFYMTLFLVISYLRLSLEKDTDWMARIRGVDRLGDYLETLNKGESLRTLSARVSAWIHHRDLGRLKKTGAIPPRSSEIYHLVIFPVLKESREIVEPGVLSLARGRFPSSQILVVLAIEERAPEAACRAAEDLRDKYRDRFLDFLVVIHPDGLPGEARVKGANVTGAAKEARGYFEKNNIPVDHVIVSCFDADTVVSPDYFSCLTYSYLVCPDRTRASYQPIPVYHNNIWEAPGFSRVLEMGSSFFQLIEATNPDKLVTFSSHSMSFKALVDVDYWPVDMISDDSAIFWKAFLHYEGRYRVVPMYVTLSMDVVSAGTWWKTIVNVYKQKRRWAWGVENFPIVIRGFLRSDKIPFTAKVRHGFKLFEGHISWATWAFMLTVIGWFPALAIEREFSDSVLYYSAPRITATIFNLASVALVTTIIISLCLLPKKRVRNPFLKRMGLAVEWLLIPCIATFLSALPALDAQTRLMFGKYMEFWVTDKSRSRRS